MDLNAVYHEYLTSKQTFQRGFQVHKQAGTVDPMMIQTLERRFDEMELMVVSPVILPMLDSLIEQLTQLPRGELWQYIPVEILDASTWLALCPPTGGVDKSLRWMSAFWMHNRTTNMHFWYWVSVGRGYYEIEIAYRFDVDGAMNIRRAKLFLTPENGLQVESTPDDYEGAHHIDSLFGWIVLAISIVSQQTIIQTMAHRPQRAMARREQRTFSVDNIPEFKTIDLRRIERKHAHNGESEREYHHRWIVNGHWRNQWYPSLEAHQFIYILPHVKGPPDAPLLPKRDTIKFLKR